jgi:hypothetical protein
MLSSPNLIIAALAQHTKRLRFGNLVNVVPLHDPMRLAEECAILDILTGGRLNVGLGRGVPRDDLTTHMQRTLGRYLRHPAVRARVMLRIGVVGEVTKPGYYQVPVDAAFADAVMLAGGATKDARMRDLHVERDKRTVLSANAARDAVASNATLDQVALMSGDLITVPRDKTWDAETWVRVSAMLVTIPLAVLTLSRAR